MAGIDFSKFSQDFKAKFEKAIADKKICAEEFQGFSAEDQAELSRQLANTPGHIGDIIVIQNAYKSKQGTLEFYAGASSQEGKVELSQDTISKYPNAGKFGNFNKGVVTILDKDGKVLKDSLGNPIKFDFSTDLEIDSTVDNVQGGFKTIEGENFQRTNRRFAIALIRSMYDKVIVENQKMLEQLGLLNASLWREGLGMGIQKIADSIDADQKAITATTAKKIEQMVEERDKICNALEKQLDNPSGFSDEFSKLVGSNFSDMNFDKLRETCHNKENEKDDTIRYNKTVEDFNEMYPDNNVTKYLEGNFVTKSLDTVTKLCDSVADILVMFWTTGGIGGTLGKASMKGFANCSKFFIKDICEKNYKEAIAQLPKLSSFMAGAAHSAPTMSAFEGGKALINSATNGEDLTTDEILSRTIDGFIGGAEMGVEMAGLQAFAIAPIMNKLSPVLGKMTGASSKIKELLKKNGEMSLEDISKVYDDCIQTTRGKIAQEGLHLGVSLPIMIPGFTGIDSAKAFLSNGDNSYKEDEFREQLLKEAKTQEERVRISAMNSFELKAEFVKRNFQAQLEGMTTIEGVSLALRRFQAARLAGQAVPKPVNNLLGAKIKTVEKDGKHLYEVVQENGKTLKFDMNDGKTVSKFSSPERAIAAYQAMCVKIVNEFKAELEKADNTPHPNPLPQGAREQGEVRTGGIKKPHVTPETVIKNFTLSDELLASEVTTKTAVPKIDNILDKVFDETTIPKTKAILEEIGLTKEEIASIDLKDSNKQRAIEALNNALKYIPKFKMEVTKDAILSFLTESNDEITTFLSGEAKFFTDDNCKLLAKHVIFDESGELNKILDSDNNPQVIMELLPVLTQNGKHKLLGSELQSLGYCLDNPNNVAKITPENIDLLYKINEKIEDKNYALELRDILNFENTTPEFADNYVKEANRFAKFGLENFSEKDLQKRINKRKAVSDFLEEYPIDVTTYDYINKQNTKLSGSNVYQLSQYSNKAEVQKFVNSLTKETRTQFIECADFVDKGFPAEKFANLLNEAAKNDFGEIKDRIYNLLNKMVETGSKDYDDMIDLVMAYKGTKCLSWYGNEEYVQVANGDFKGAAKYVELAKELGMNPEHYSNLISDKDADFNVATSNLAYVKENGIDINLYDRYTLLRDKKFKINNEKIKYLETQGITRLADMYRSINTEFESDISIEEFKAKFEYINEFIAKNQDTDLLGLDSDYFKVKFTNNDLTINQVKELFNITQNHNFEPFASLNVLDVTSNLTLELFKKLCAYKDFPKDQIADIIRYTNQNNLAFAEKLCADKDFPKDQIAGIISATNKDNLAFAEKLCANKDFPKDEIAYIIGETNKDNLTFAEKLCADKDFPKYQIAGIIRETNKDNLAFAEKLCADKDFPKDQIAGIIIATNKGNLAFAEKLCADKDFPKDQIANIIRATNKDNQAFLENLCANENVPKDKILEISRAIVINDPNDAGGNNGKIDAKKVDRYTRLFQNPNTAKWAGDMLKQGFDIETISKLAPTKQSFFTESVKPTETTQKVVEEKAVSPIDAVKQETILEFENLGLDTKQANAVFKSIAKNGVVDTSLKVKAIELINKGVAKNKIGDILNSAQITGEFNSKIVDDFVLLQNRGLNPLLEKNLAVLNNISGADCAVKFNSKVRNQIKAMINNLPEAVKISLKEQGIEIDSILKKLDSQVVRTSNNVPTRAKVESGFRSKAKITGFERIVVDKYEPTEQVWRNEEATKKWAEEKYLAFKNREYVSTRNTADDPQLGEKVTQKRKEMLKEWYDFMETDENIKNNPFVKVILCDFITKELEPERSTTPPALNKDVVKQILGDAANSSNFSFSNAYAKKMKELSAKNSQGQQVEVNGKKGTWYTVPKTDSSSPDFKANAAKIRAFSDGTNWCIRTWNAEPYVQKGAMHFFVDENGLTQICIREQGEPGSVYEIQKRQQDQTAPVAYLDVIQSYMKEQGLKPQSYCQGELDKAIKQKPEYDKLKSELDVLNNKKDYKGILEKMGITVTILPDGTFELSHYTSYIDRIALNDFGINENELLANVSRIKGNANFKDSNATTLPNLSEVGGKLDFGYANISNIKNLKSINGQEIKWQ